MTSGVVPDSAIDTLLMYGYAEPAVADVVLEISDPSAEKQSVVYKLTLHYLDNLKYQAVERAQAITNPILKKATLLGLLKVGAPVSLKDNIVARAKEYLPPTWNVEVHIVE